MQEGNTLFWICHDQGRSSVATPTHCMLFLLVIITKMWTKRIEGCHPSRNVSGRDRTNFPIFIFGTTDFRDEKKKKKNNCASRTSSNSMNDGNAKVGHLVSTNASSVDSSVLTSRYANNSPVLELKANTNNIRWARWIGPSSVLNYGDQGSWAVVLIFLCKSTKVNKLWHSAVKRQLKQQKEKQEVFPSNYAKSAWCSVTNKHE